jgi:hypothetical protein
MPTAVDLVTDLPADFEVFGQAVDSSMADLLGGTSGQILAKNTNANMDFVWINNDQGDITGVTAGTGITVTDPTGPVPTVTNAMATEITAKGDLIVGTGNAAFDNLPAGTNDHVLTADSTVSPTGLKWAALPAGGAYTSLASGSIVNGLSLTSISGSYTDLYLVINNAAPTATDQIGIRINNMQRVQIMLASLCEILRERAQQLIKAHGLLWIFLEVRALLREHQTILGLFIFPIMQEPQIGKPPIQAVGITTIYRHLLVLLILLFSNQLQQLID